MGKYLKPGLAVVALGLLALFGSRFSSTPIIQEEPVTESGPSYSHQLKVGKKVVRTYRSPAAVVRRPGISGAYSSPSKTYIQEKNLSPEIEERSTNGTVISSSGNTSGYSRNESDNNPRQRYNPYSSGNQSSTSSSSTGNGTASSVIPGGSLIPPGTTTDTGTSSGTNSNPETQDKTPPTEPEPEKIPSLYGKVKPLTGLISSNTFNPFISSAYAANNCVNPRILLFDLKDMSILLDNPISDEIIKGEANFTFDPLELEMEIKTPTRYLLHTSGCEKNFQRIVTSFYSPQDLDFITTFISKIINTENGLSEGTAPGNLDDLYAIINKEAGDNEDLNTIYGAVKDIGKVNNLFGNAFPDSTITDLKNSAPELNQVKYHTKVAEKNSYQFEVQASHWDPSYQIAYQWKVGNDIVSTSSSWDYVPDANSPLNQKVTLTTGKALSNGNIDKSIPHHEIDWDIDIEDSYPAQAPLASFGPLFVNPTSIRDIPLEIEGGLNCETFSSYAITENDQTLNTASFNRKCVQNGSHSLKYSLETAGDGPHVIKLWSKDIEGRVSETPRELIFVVDTTPPEIKFVNVPSNYSADLSYVLEWTLKEQHSSSNQNFVVDFFNGSSWVQMGTLSLTPGPHDETHFSYPFSLPNMNIIKAKFRVSYADTLGLGIIAETSDFNVYRPNINSDPVTINMGQIKNKSSQTVNFNFINTGLTPSKSCSPITLSGPEVSEFIIMNDGCSNSVIPAQGTCPMTVMASSLEKGTRRAFATITCGNDTYTAPLIIESTNNAPLTADKNHTTLEDSPLYINLGSIVDIDEDGLIFSFPIDASHGQISNCYISGGEYLCQYSPDLNFNGSDSFSYRTFDGLNYSNTSTVSLTIIPVNDAPELTGTLSLSTNEDIPLDFDLVPGTDVDLDTLSYDIITPPLKGTLSCPMPTTLNCTYTPDQDYNGSDSFTYRVLDGTLSSSGTITASIAVIPVNDAPIVAIDQNFSTRDNVDFNFTISQGDDIDSLVSSLKYKLVTPPTVGTLSNCIDASTYTTDRTCTYKAPVHYQGPVTFTYLVHDDEFDSNSVATITIDVEDMTPTVPVLAPANFTPTVSTTASLLTLTAANCDDVDYVKIQEDSTIPLATDSGWQACSTLAGALTFDPTLTNTQGFRTLRIYGRDQNENISNAQLMNFIYDTTAPQITIEQVPTLPNGIVYPIKWRLTEASVSASSVFKIHYSLDNGATWAAAPDHPVSQAGPHAATLFTYNWSVPAGTHPQSLIKVTLTDNNGMTGTSTSNQFRILIDLEEPNLLDGGMKINGSTLPAPTPQKYVNVNLSALDDDTNITHFCFKNNSTQPAPSDPCWRAVDAPMPGLAASPTLDLTNFPYLLGFVPGTFNVYAWVRDLRGNISINTNTVGKDRVSITYFGDTSPVITNFMVANTSTPPNPITSNEMVFHKDDPVYIRWTATDDKVIKPTISLSYTTDDIEYVEIVGGLSNGSNSGCDLDGSTGCYSWVTPEILDNQYFRVQLIVEDDADQATSILSLPMNSERFKVLAGNIDPGVGSHAKSALISPPGSPALYSLAVATDGKVFIRDASFGLMYINPQTGIYEQLLKVTGVSSGDNGPVRDATANHLYKITMDYQDRLIIWDYDRIRRVDTKTEPMKIETIIGAYNNGAPGTQTTDIVTDPADLKVFPGPGSAMILQPLPNGDIYFQPGPYGSVNNGNTLRVYRGSLPAPTINTIRVSGTGAARDFDGAPMSLTEDTVTSYALDFNSETSALNKIIVQLYDTEPGCSFYAFAGVDLGSYASAGPHPPVHASTCGDAYLRNGLDGKMYNIGYHVAYTVQVSRYNNSSNSHEAFLGNGQGYCVDGTPAATCRTNIVDVFVTQEGKVFFIDNGVVRVIDDANNVQTLYAQTKTYGDNGLAQDARFNNTYYIDHGVGDNVIVYDHNEKVLREIRPNETSSQVVLLAGNGQTGNINFSALANSQTMNGANWDQPGVFSTNPLDGSVYFPCTRANICKLNRLSGKWEIHSGNNTPSVYTNTWHQHGSSDGTLTHYGGYSTTPLAYYNGRILTGHYSYNSDHRKSQYATLRELAVSSKTTTFIAGKPEVDGTTGCPDGKGSNCNLNSARSDGRAVTYHTPTNSWLYESFSNQLRLIKTAGDGQGSVTHFATIADGVQSMVWQSGILYYCNDSGELKKWDVANDTNVILPFPGSGISCYGYDLLWKAASGEKPNRLVFPFKQNGLSGIAEYMSP